MRHTAEAEFIQIRSWELAPRCVTRRRHCRFAGLSCFVFNCQDKRTSWLLCHRCWTHRSTCHTQSRWHSRSSGCTGQIWSRWHRWSHWGTGRRSRITRGIAWHPIHRRRWRCHWWCHWWWCRWWCRWVCRWESCSCQLISWQWCRRNGRCQRAEAIVDSLNQLFIAFSDLSMDGLQPLFGRCHSSQNFVGNGFEASVGFLFGTSNLPFQVLEWT